MPPNDFFLDFDDFIEKLRPDPKEVGNPLVIVQGLIGASSEDGHVRVYLDDALNEFIDVPEKDICYAVKLDEKDHPEGGSKLWVNADAIFMYGDPSQPNTRSKGSFLQGDIANSFAGQAGGPVDGPYLPNGPVIAARTFYFTCYNYISCRGRTCFHISCYRTCWQISCFRTCRQISCWGTCFISCYRTCNWPCYYVRGPIEANPYSQARYNQPGQGTGFEGFNPYTGF